MRDRHSTITILAVSRFGDFFGVPTISWDSGGDGCNRAFLCCDWLRIVPLAASISPSSEDDLSADRFGISAVVARVLILCRIKEKFEEIIQKGVLIF